MGTWTPSTWMSICTFSLIMFFLPAYLLTRAKDPVGNASPDGD